MSLDKMQIADKLDAQVVRPEVIKEAPKAEVVKETPSIVPKTNVPTAAPVHILMLPKTLSETVLQVNDYFLSLPAGQPSVAIEAHFPFSITYGKIVRTFTGGDPIISGSVNLSK